jgi:hypothetical protein
VSNPIDATDATDAIDAYLADLARRLSASSAVRAALLEEVRSHLEEAARQRETQGVAAAGAAAQAIAAFGLPSVVAGRLNAVHAVDWDRRRMVTGMLAGALGIWTLWTLITYPLLVQLAAQHTPLRTGTSPVALLFSATPLAFGLFDLLTRNGMWWVALPLLLLFGAVPFAWGRQARQSWRPGCAYGLGVVVGMPWLLPAIPMHWGTGSPAALLLVVGAIWMLLPYAMLASWAGGWATRAGVSLAVRLPPRPHRIAAAGMAATQRPRQRIATLALPGMILLALLAVNAASFVRTSMLGGGPSQLSAADQLAAAQAAVPFPIRQPRSLPDGVTLESVTVTQMSCGRCGVSLQYTGPQGARLILGEGPADDSTASMALPSPPNYEVSDVTGQSYQPIWWLGTEVTTEHQINLAWTAHGLDYFLGSDAAWPVEVLKQVAASV